MDLQAFLTEMIRAATIIRDFAIAMFSSAVGWFYLVNAGWRLHKWSDPRRQYGFASIMIRTIVGTLLINSANYVNSVVMTFTGYGMPDQNAMSVMTGSTSGTPALIFKTALIWLAAMGVIAILRGAQLIVKAGDGNGGPSEKDPVFTGFVYIVSGAIGVNLWRFAGALL